MISQYICRLQADNNRFAPQFTIIYLTNLASIIITNIAIFWFILTRLIQDFNHAIIWVILVIRLKIIRLIIYLINLILYNHLLLVDC